MSAVSYETRPCKHGTVERNVLKVFVLALVHHSLCQQSSIKMFGCTKEFIVYQGNYTVTLLP